MKYFLCLLIGLFVFPIIVYGSWAPPSTAPFFCPTNDPACSVPLSASGNAQIKSGSLGVTGNLSAYQNFFANKSGIGPRYVNGTFNSSSMPIGSTLDLDGQISIRGGAPDINKVLKSVDSSGLAIWGEDFWRYVAATNNIENTNAGTVYFNGALAKRSAIISGSTAPANLSASTHVNLGDTSSSGSVNGPSTLEARNYITIGGGANNTARWNFTTISGGGSNSIQANPSSYGVIRGGLINSISGDAPYSYIGGGTQNSAGVDASFVAILGGAGTAGVSARAGGDYSTILGGNINRIGVSNDTSKYAIAGGRQANLGDDSFGTFIWENNSAAQTAIVNAPNSFLIFPRNSVADVGIGTTTNSSFDVNVAGTMKIESSSAAALEVSGRVKIMGGGPVSGEVLKTLDGTGLASWEPPAKLIGGSVMVLKAPASGCPLTTPANCPGGWTEYASSSIAVFQENVQGPLINNVRTCYRTDTSCQVMYISQRISSAQCGASPWVDADVPSCPSGNGWNQAWVQGQRADLGGGYNLVRTCYRCSY